MPATGKEKQRAQSQRTKAMPNFEQGVDGQYIERTKAGTISRMRSHNGNKPMIPQEQFCPQCPAKFTRVTHLQRHMRTHLETREYKCERCSSEFTRSDLLTRHRRTCGDPTSAHRSRQRSCKACVDGKAKCDLNQPCSRCLSKQWSCIYERRDGASPGAMGLPPSASEDIKPHLSLMPPGTAGPSNQTPYVPLENSRSLSQLSDDPDLHLLESIEDIPNGFNNVYRTHAQAVSSYAGSSYADSSFAESSIFSGDTPRYDTTYPHLTQENFVQGAYTMSQTINTLFSENLIQQYYYDVIDKQPGAAAAGISSSVSMPNLPQRDGTVPWDMQPFMADVPGGEMFYADALMGISTLMNDPPPPPPQLLVPAPAPHVSFPYPSEYQHYIHLFYNLFLAQMPVVHTATFSVEGKPHVLISAMQACGALYSRTPAAVQFIEDTLASARDELVTEFSKNPVDFDMQVHLILAVVLLQTIGLFHQTAEQRAQSNQYHRMLVLMIRQTGLVQYITAWRPPTREQLDAGERVWHQWAFHETTKRALLLSYLHDTCHCIYFTLPPFYDASEMTVPLPCENAMWKASTYQEWRRALLGSSGNGGVGKPDSSSSSSSSGYGTLHERLQPMGLQVALGRLADQYAPETEPPIVVTPFAHFILTHAILRKFFVECVGGGRSQGHQDRAEEGREVHGGGGGQEEEEEGDMVYNIQFMLHKWVRSWYASPDTPKEGVDGIDPIFLHDALPFFWIAQVLLLAQRDNLLPFGHGQEGNDKDRSGEAKYTLMKEWLRLVREQIRKGKGEGTVIWDQFMKIRMKSKQEESDGGLLGFFAEGA
ncbi:fungal-specific transcription factor domain-containing protein [Irpex rosettiformis]|uniref:Fungal-specific transcription factor domain-containing protein n=1 Tax=Irpex rosettiformis TaxID=378272 RepID=A0ACB8UGZ2_9APHY|nr:fungal-specific transcription factor domain-containing protein [Irpex rosettiformis]